MNYPKGTKPKPIKIEMATPIEQSSTMNIVIDYQFVSLNEYINIERGNKFAAADIKSKETNAVKMLCIGKKWHRYPCKIKFIWHVVSKKKDLDNIAFAKKFILDGLVKAGTLKNDNLNHILAFEDKVVFDKKEYVELEIEQIS
jgi:Holliday junction resolvase RusA-like endonuclease